MPRSNFSVNIPSSCTTQILPSPPGSPQNVADGRFASEASSGVSRRKPSGWIPPTGYTYTYRSYTRAFGRCSATSPSNPNLGVVYTGCVGSGSVGRFNSLNHFDELILESAITDGSLANLALIAARGNLRQKKVDLGVAFGERKQTAQLVGDTTKRIARSVQKLRRGKIRDAMSELGLASKKGQPRGSNWTQNWLELQYAWKPLLSDVYGACDALSKRPKRDWTVTARASRSSVKAASKNWTGPDCGVGSARASTSAFVRIDAQPDNEALISLSSVGVTNPLLVGWELVPYSFVVDWFLPIGGWLESLDATLGFSSMYTSTSVLTRAEWHGNGANGGNSSNVYKNSYYEGKRVVLLTRSAQAGVPIPRFPSIKDPRSLGHMANGLALLAQAFGR